jgi:hypothetical protein
MVSHICTICGREDKLYEKGRCERCSLARRTAELMAGPDGKVPAALAAVADTIVASATPRKALNWLRQGAGAPILAQLAAGTMAVSHEALDAHPRPRAANHIRQMLIAHGALAARDEQLATLERLNTATVASIGRPEDRNTVAAFATWRVLRGLRRRAEHNTTKRTAIGHARNQVLGAVCFLDWLAARHLTLATASQGDLELWLATRATVALRRPTFHRLDLAAQTQRQTKRPAAAVKTRQRSRFRNTMGHHQPTPPRHRNRTRRPGRGQLRAPLRTAPQPRRPNDRRTGHQN